MKYKSKANQYTALAIFPIVGAILIYFFVKSTFAGSLFSFIVPFATMFSLIFILIGIVLVIISFTQWYEITNDKIIGRHLTKIEIPFSSIKEINLINVENNIRVRYGNPKAMGMGFQLASKTIGASSNLNKNKLEDINSILNKYNKETTLTKLKVFNSQTLVISTKNGEHRILPNNMGEFIFELNEKYMKSQGRKLKINSSKIIT